MHVNRLISMHVNRLVSMHVNRHVSVHVNRHVSMHVNKDGRDQYPKQTGAELCQAQAQQGYHAEATTKQTLDYKS